MAEKNNKRKEKGNVGAKLFFSGVKKQDVIIGAPALSNIEEDWEGYRGPLTVLPMPYPPERLLQVVDTSNVLQQCIAVMEVNVDGQGYVFDAIEDPEISGSDAADATVVAAEYQMLVDTFEAINFDYSFIKLRRKTRIDLESFGNAYWEVIRNGSGRLVELNHIPAVSVRLTARERDPILVEQKVIQDGKVVVKKRWRRWRRIVQRTAHRSYMFFKEFGDTRMISTSSGEVLQRAVPEYRQANEVIHFRLDWAGNSPYGVPRWIGNLLSSLGSRASEELNYLYFIQGRHMPFAILVSGGMLTSESEVKLKEMLDEAKGVEYAHKILLLEAETADDYAGGSTNVKLEIKPLVDVLPDDALFQKYDSNNRDKVRTSFRFPKVLIGESEDYNRDTVEAAIKVANAQVFDPERNDFDDMINRKLFPELGAVHHKFKSKSFRPVGATDLSNILFRLNKMGSTTPRMILPIIREMLGTDLQFPSGADWIDRPMELTQTLITAGKVKPDGEPGAAASEDEQKAIALVKSLGLVPEQAARAVDVVEGLVTLRKALTMAIEQGITD
jgi:PBSX family phage portal protein